jgi:hypothetical protein
MGQGTRDGYHQDGTDCDRITSGEVFAAVTGDFFEK